SPIWNNNGVSLTFHIPRIDIKGVVKVCVLLPDGSCHGNATIIYQSSPSCTNTAPRSSWVSGKREITLTGSHLEFAEGVVHSLLLQEVRPPRNTDFKHLTYYTPAAGNAQSSFTSSVFLRVANETLPCTTITYYPDPEFTSFETIRTGDDVLITVQKKADKLEMTPEELTVWGINEDKQYPCIMEGKTNNNKPEFFICQIQSPPSATFEQLMAVSSSPVIRPMMVVSSANLMMVLELWVTTQSCVNREYSRGLSTQPWGAVPVFRVRVEDVVLPIRTAWGREAQDPVREGGVEPEIMYGDKTVTLGRPSLIHQVLQILRFLLIPCVIIVLVAICQWQKKLTAEMKKY
ncbi:hypothetical protein L3Q82_009558, partial [Scortum barcoo]